MAPRAHPGRPHGGVAGQQRGLGPVPRPVLGHAAPHLAVCRGARALRRIAGRALRAGRARRHRRRPPPARHRRRHLRLPRVRGRDGTTPGPAGTPRCDGSNRSSTPGSTRVRCPPPSGATRWPRDRPIGSSTPPTSSARPSTRPAGWFYSLLAVNTLVRGATPYRNVLCLGHLVDADGRKMSKSVGNVIDPWEILDTRGADPLRWWMFSQGSPWTPTRVSFEAIDAADAGHPADLVEHLVVLHHLRVPQRLRSRRPGHSGTGATARSSTGGCGRGWRATVAAATEALDGYEPFPAAAAIAELIDDVSNWYVRRSRRRFWRTDPDADPADSLGAQATLHEVLVTRPACWPPCARSWPTGCGATSPVPPTATPSTWPTGPSRGPRPSTRRSRRGWPWPVGSPRSDVRPGPRPGIKVRQPLARALVYLPPGSPTPPAGVVEDELNVDVVEAIDELSDVLTYELVPNFKLLGSPARVRGSSSSGRPWARWTRRPPPPSWPPDGRWWSSWPTDPSS